MRKRTWLHGAILLALLVALNSCASLGTVAPAQYGNPSSDQRVAIFLQASQFKRDVAKCAADGLSGEGVFVETLDLRTLSEETAANYDAVVILDTYVAWKVSPGVEKFVKAMEQKQSPKLLLFVTAGDPEGVNDIPGVDTVSAASETGDPETLCENVVSRTLLKMAE